VNFSVDETQTFGKNHSKFQKHFFGINQFLRRDSLGAFGQQQNYLKWTGTAGSTSFGKQQAEFLA
jgi:hypothetical protein